MKNPLWSAVFYLTDKGGGTAVFEQTTKSRKLATRAYVCYPRINRACLFNGKALHGVLPGMECGGGRRTTVMVAVWDGDPGGRRRDMGGGRGGWN